MKLSIITCLLFSIAIQWQGLIAQDQGEFIGKVLAGGEPIAKASIQVGKTRLGATTDDAGVFKLSLSTGQHSLRASAVGYLPAHVIAGVPQSVNDTLFIVLKRDNLGLGEVVVSATRNGVERTKAPVVVNVLSKKLFTATQSMSMSEVLNYQPGVRLETNCQNCGFTQVRMNGLEGAYSQILINSRPIFSALNSVYGLDQIPTSMIERIEVVRSGGSALFGSNAIAGTINIITKDPVLNSWEVSSNTALIGGESFDNTLNFNTSVVSEDLNSGGTFYGMVRNRLPYDANGDGFTEITKMEQNTFGGKVFYKPSEYNKLSIDFSAIREFRRGGDRLDLVPHFTDITEQLDHRTLIGGLTFDQYSKDYKNKFSAYASAQRTVRRSYYGGLGGGRDNADSIAASNAYGLTHDMAFVGGAQFTRNFEQDVLTLGAEHQFNQVDDEIAGYNRLIDQKTNNTGLYAQYEWKPSHRFTTLLGGRYDMVHVTGDYRIQDLRRTSDVNRGVFSPRLTLLYELLEELQFRGGYARGFRAPQAFDEDMHVSSVAGEQRFVILSGDLNTEYSDAFTASLNWNRLLGATQFSFLAEGFYTALSNPFTTVSTGASLPSGALLEEVRNGSGAYVYGTNLELNVVPSPRFSFQAGGTIQRSLYREEQELFDPEEDVPGESSIFVNRLMRTPDLYGYFNVGWKPDAAFSVDLSGVYTGRMIVPHVVNESGFMDLVHTQQFMELNGRLAYTFNLRDKLSLEWSGGVQNLFNSYQNDFDSGPGRDSDYIYGPFRPRTYFLGLKIGGLY